MKSLLVKQLCFAGMMLLFTGGHVLAQDSVHITLQKAEEQFMQKNLQLLAEKYNISIADAQMVQAKLYPNPNFSVTANAYDPSQHKFFNVSNSSGEYQLQLQQLIRLAGKRNKEIQLAKISIDRSSESFRELLRSLLFSLRSTFYNLYYLQRSAGYIDTELQYLQKLSDEYDALQKKDVVTLRDAVRIKSLYYSLKAERASLQNDLTDAEADMRILLQDNNRFFSPDVSDPFFSSVKTNAYSLQALTDTAMNNRPDIGVAKQNALYDLKNVSYQKALAVPDLTAGAQFDKRGSFVDNASFISLAIDLPFFNRNKGNIRAANISLQQSNMQVGLTTAKAENDVQRAYTKALNAEKELASVDPSFQANYDALLQGVTENFRKKNISLIEFTDFYESYRDNAVQINRLMNDRMQAIEQLNLAAGKIIFNK